MPRYLLELYVPRGQGLDEATARAQLVHEKDVRYVRTMFIAEDETCFHVFEAASREVLLEAVTRSGLGEARVIEAVETDREEAG
jgi:hypothetical protein